ncbi:uncharacterized protein LOC107607130 [Arachis ipaensis]|uniref:uncharacterized protein LOC107607130 n=1 Tax=Arachis ipaensis TaxID=130454 RepID=UPI0007AF32CE|nr:uncharacterized protein LOC107607130 [Arachis ipaensis]
MATRGRGRARSRESRNAQPANNHAEFLAAMANLANTIEANATATLQAVQRLGQPAGNENGNGEGNAHDIAEGNGDNTGDVSMTLATFLKVHPPIFRGLTNPTEANNWFQAMERALQAQHILNNQYVEFTAYQLAGQAQHWWQVECRLLQLQNTDVLWDGAPETYERWKCIKYQRGLKESIMTAVASIEICVFSDLVNKARVVEEYAKTVAASKDTHGGNTNKGRGKYFHPRGQSFKRGGYVPQGQGGFRKNTHDQFQRGKGRENQSKISPDLACDRCGRFHPYDSCRIGLGGCFNYGLPGHIVRDCTRGRNPNAGQSQHQGRVFAVNAKNASKADPLMRGICLIGDKTLIALYDTGASHLFISFAKFEELGLKVFELAFDLHVHTPHQTIMTRSGCRQVGFKMEGRDFVHDLICLPMIGLEIILGFDWLSKNRVLLDCFKQSIRFMPEGESGAVVAVGYYLNSVIVHYSGEECQSYILLAANALDDVQSLDQIPVVRDFPKVFPEDIPEFPPQREVKFAIELVPGAGSVSITPYRMAPIELAELRVDVTPECGGLCIASAETA